MTRMKQALQEYEKNDPPIEPNQIWIGTDGDKVLRRIRILALHLDEIDGRRAWIYQEQAAKMRNLDIGRLGICPEFNLRFVFHLET